MKRSMKEIALYLLEQYYLSESSVIGEFSGSIEKDLAILDNEIAELRREIEEADRTVSIDAAIQKAARKLAYIHSVIDLYGDRPDLHEEEYWAEYLTDPEWHDPDIEK